MDATDEILGDVISIGSTSDEELTPSRKRSHDEADDSGRSSQDAGSSLRGAKRQRTKEPDGAHSGAPSGSEEGEVNEESSDSYEPEPAVPASEGGQPGQSGDQATWGVDLSKSSDGTRQASPQAAQRPANSAKLAYLPPNPPVFRKKLKLPLLSGKPATWSVRFKDWVQVLAENNPEALGTLLPDVALAAYNHYVDQKSGLRRGKKRGARQAAQAVGQSGELAALLRSLGAVSGPLAPDGATAQSSKPVEPVSVQPESTAAPPQPTVDVPRQGDAPGDMNEQPVDPQSMKAKTPEPPVKDAGSPVADVAAAAPRELTAAEKEQLNLQRRYFPSAADPSKMCLMCGHEGHTAVTCSHLVCIFCNEKHWRYACPSRSRCQKCRQIGHSAGQCTEKLALTKDEGLACSFCQAPDHLEKDCTESWRSFHPDIGSTTKVSFIPASCAICGSDKHFASDCQQCLPKERNPTWSLKNRDRYVDPECQVLSIEQSVRKNDPAAAKGPEHKIRGHAARTNNVHYSESEDSEVEFLGTRAMKPRAPLGQIHVASNIQLPNHARNRGSQRGRAQNQPRGQPPLPPGPPPPRPPPPPSGPAAQQSGYRAHPPPPGTSSYSHPRAPPTSLPAKPPAGRDYRGVPPPPPPAGPRHSSWQRAQDGRGGRGGGGRGGGRGKGRGRGK